jgi:outer membrane protein W
MGRARLLGLGAALVTLAASRDAQAQYKNYTFGFAGGYLGQSTETGLKGNNAAFGIFGGYKFSDHWWYEGGASLSFPGELDNTPNTVIVLDIVPISVRYYYATDAIRPYSGITNMFQFMFNTSTNFQHSVFWGPGLTSGIDIKLKRDLYLGFEGDIFRMLVFEGSDAWIGTLSAKIIFFL